jgi:hypothetical protein
MKSYRGNFGHLFALLSVVAFFGCGSNSVQDRLRAENATNIMKVTNAYKLYANMHENRGPASADELKQFLKTNQQIKLNLELMGLELSELDSYFVSEVDGEEFVIRWDIPITASIPLDPIAFDKTGVDGVRRVSLACDVVIEAKDDATYERLMEGDVKRSDPPPYVFPGGIDSSSEADDS